MFGQEGILDVVLSKPDFPALKASACSKINMISDLD
jgi:hypothetical protein